MPHTGESQWAGLLQALTDEELGQYGALAQDQIAREARWRWVQLVSCMLGAVVAAWAVVTVARSGLDTSGLLWLAVAAGLLYWPYRSRKTQVLWRRHVNAVAREQSRRSGGGNLGG